MGVVVGSDENSGVSSLPGSKSIYLKNNIYKLPLLKLGLEVTNDHDQLV